MEEYSVIKSTYVDGRGYENTDPLTDLLNSDQFKYSHHIDDEIENISLYIAEYHIINSNPFIYKNNTIVMNKDIIKLSMSITWNDCDNCNLRNGESIILELDKTIDIPVCPYYDNAAKIIQKRFKWNQKLPILWKIAEYYTQKKYSPENAIKYIKFD